MVKRKRVDVAVYMQVLSFQKLETPWRNLAGQGADISVLTVSNPGGQQTSLQVSDGASFNCAVMASVKFN